MAATSTFTGPRPRVDDNERPTYRGLSLLAVDVERGAIVAEALSGARISRVAPAPDGRSVYVTGYGKAEGSIGPTEPSSLWRLHGVALAVLAEREFTGPRQLVVQPTGRAAAPRSGDDRTLIPIAAIVPGVGPDTIAVGDRVTIEARFADPASGKMVEPGREGVRYEPPARVTAILTPKIGGPVSVVLDATGYGVFRGHVILPWPGNWAVQVVADWPDGQRRGARANGPVVVQAAFAGSDGRRYLLRLATAPAEPVAGQPAIVRASFVDAESGAPLPAGVALGDGLPGQITAHRLVAPRRRCCRPVTASTRAT